MDIETLQDICHTAPKGFYVKVEEGKVSRYTLRLDIMDGKRQNRKTVTEEINDNPDLHFKRLEHCLQCITFVQYCLLENNVNV